MIQSDANPKDQPSIAAKPKIDTTPKTTTFAVPPSAPPHSAIQKRSVILLLVVLFVAAIAGGLLAFQNFSKSQLDVTQEDETLAWRPYSVVATCSGVKVIGHVEKTSYDFKFTFVLTQPNRSGTVAHTFSSKPVNNGHKIDEDVRWSDLGAEGAAFGSLLRTNDTVNWEVEVSYILNNKPTTERYADSVKIFDTSCSSQSSASPSATAVATAVASPSATVRVTATPRATATVTPTRSPSPTPEPTEPPTGGGPSTTPTPTATPTVAATTQATATPGSNNTTTTQSTNPPTSVAQKDSDQLPTAGVSNGVLFAILGTLSLVVSGAVALTRKRFD